MEEKKAQKATFFTDLYHLDEPDEPDERDKNNENREENEEFQNATSTTLKPRNTHAAHHQSSLYSSQRVINAVLNRTISTHLPSAAAENASILKSTSHGSNPTAKPVSNDQALKDGHTMPRTGKITKPLAKNKNARKRKREETLEVLPENQQIFRGLAFCMIVDE